MSFRGDRGIYELLEIMFQGPAWQLHVAVFLTFALIFRLLFGIAAWLDRDRRAASALRWVWAARSLRRLAFFIMILALAALALPSDARQIAATVGVLLVVAAFISAYFFAWNPQTLQREALLGWWRLYWPGWKTVALVLGISCIANAGLDIAALWWAEDGRTWVLGLGWAVSFLAEIALSFMAYVIWFGYRRWDHLRTAWLRLCRSHVLRAYVGLEVYSAIAILLMAAPVLVSSIVAIYFEPQFQDWANAHGGRLPWLLQSIAAAGRGFGEDHLWMVLVLPWCLLWAFVEARLIFQDGLGAELGPSARRR